jgi:hypothetical protein
MNNIEQFLTDFSGQTFSSNKEAMDWLRERLISFEKEVKTEFLKKILPEQTEEHQPQDSEDYYGYGWERCLDLIKTNAEKYGIKII